MINEAIVAAAPPLSPYRRVGDLVFVSGQLPRDASGRIVRGGIAEQTAQAITNVGRVLADAGLRLSDVVKVTVWLTDAAYLQEFNAAYREHFSEPYPTRSTVISGLVAGDIEIEVVACAPAPAQGSSTR